MESFINSLTAANAELALSYSETLNSLVNYNSELTYNPSSSTSSTNQRTAQLAINRKLPTKLSKNPSTYEKELRNLVLNLYSDEERLVKEHTGNQSVDMASSTQDRIIHGPQTKGTSFWGAQKIPVPQPLNVMHVTEPQKSQSESGSEGYGSLDNGVTQIEENGIQNLQELQEHLVKLQNNKQGTVILVFRLQMMTCLVIMLSFFSPGKFQVILKSVVCRFISQPTLTCFMSFAIVLPVKIRN